MGRRSPAGGSTTRSADARADSPRFPLAAYPHDPHFAEATFENWESEFLGLGTVVLLSVWLRQRGSPESKPCEELTGFTDQGSRAAGSRRGGYDDGDDDKRSWSPRAPDAPGPVRHGGWLARLYAHSLSLALFGLFVLCFGLHAWSSLRKFNAANDARGEPTVSWRAHLTDAEFWFESLQNWQSEFFSEGLPVVLAVYLRQRDSPQSKPVEAPHTLTGGD